ncbi:ATP-binding protein [Streptomyces beigongshangae]|uniref:ATP-binding protein n=1 Tax=Streptomyces beigongshangae TaxID=2841597 RepID=UPI0021A6B47E|nr:ATP-binding protein [Streptomyces sp. REN17]
MTPAPPSRAGEPGSTDIIDAQVIERTCRTVLWAVRSVPLSDRDLIGILLRGHLQLLIPELAAAAPRLSGAWRDAADHVLAASRRTLDASAGTSDADLERLATYARALLTLRQQAGPLRCLTDPHHRRPYMTNNPTGHPGYTLELERVPQAAQQARSLVRAALACWNLEEHTDTGMLLVSELVANAVRHADGPRIRVHVDRPAPVLLLFAVADYTPARIPQLCTPRSDDVCGRGLFLLDQIADRWGHETTGSSTARSQTKRVWAELRVAAPFPAIGGSG